MVAAALGLTSCLKEGKSWFLTMALNGHGFWWTLGDGEGQGGLACCSPLGHKESDTTEQLNNSNQVFHRNLSVLCCA